MIRFFPRRVVPAALAVACLTLPGLALPAAAGPFGDEAARAIAREQLSLDAAAERVGLVAGSARGADVEVATREVDPGAIEALTTETRRAPARPAAAATATSKLDFAALDAMPPAKGGAEFQCLAQAIYFESRGEPIAGQIAVAEVVLNRVDDRNFPKTVCGVTHQGAGSGRGCQFSYVCDGHPDVMKSAVARERSEKLASLMLAGRPRTVSDGATYFHVRSIRPDWSHRFVRTTTIGHHMFYRPGTRVAGG